MSKTNSTLKFDSVTDAELLERAIIYFNKLRSVLPIQRLIDHCSGLIASIFELRYYLISKNLSDYGNY